MTNLHPHLPTRPGVAAIVLLLAAFFASDLGASAPFSFERVRAEEDWIADGDAETLASLPAYQAIALGENSWLTLGGTWRLALELNRNEGWGEVPGTDLMLLERAMVHAAWTYRPRSGPLDRVRLFAQLKHGETLGRRTEDRVPDVDRLDGNAGFLELRSRPRGSGGGGQVTLRLGRQELDYGAGRLIAIRAGATNTPISFDAALLRYSAPRVDVDVFYAFPNETDPGVFDNDRLEGRKLRGIYGTWKTDRGGLDLFAFIDERPQRYFQGSGRETRNSVGGRWFYAHGRLRQDVLFTWQWGDLRPDAGPAGAIEAWTASTQTHIRLRDDGWRPTLNLFTGYATGDDDPADPDIGTFRAPYPPGRYFGSGAPNGPLNVIFYRLGLALQPSRSLDLDLGFYDFYRESVRDGTYGVPGIPLNPPGTSGERHVGRLIELVASVPWGERGAIEFEISRFFPGAFFDDPPLEADTMFFGCRLTTTF
ncbi:MAG: alginate export family protein [Acidobacteriota bacterium]